MGNPSLSESTALPAFDSELDHFARLGFEPTVDLRRDAVEDAYLERSQRYHPDRFVGRSDGERRLAMEHSSALNRARDVLRGRVSRAEYLVFLAGIDLSSSDPERGAPVMGQAFLIEMIERREALTDARERGEEALEALRDGVDDELAERLDEAEEALRTGDVQRASRALVVHKYLRRLLSEIDGDASAD